MVLKPNFVVHSIASEQYFYDRHFAGFFCEVIFPYTTFLPFAALHSHIVVFSNDRNLCNKCMVAGIKAFSHQVTCIALLSYEKRIVKKQMCVYDDRVLASVYITDLSQLIRLMDFPK